MEPQGHVIPATPRQIAYARSLALRNQTLMPPPEVQQDLRALSGWIDRQARLRPAGDSRPSSRQVAYAERIARLRRRAVPDECFRDRVMMSRWIDSNR